MSERYAREWLREAFHSGGGVPQSAYLPDAREGMCRFTRGWFENLLLREWLPAAPDARGKLAEGARYADVGCGAGRALVELAKAFPGTRAA